MKTSTKLWLFAGIVAVGLYLVTPNSATQVPAILDVYTCDYMKVVQKNNKSTAMNLQQPVIFTVYDSVVMNGDIEYAYHTKSNALYQYKVPNANEYLQIPIDNDYSRVQLTVLSPYATTEYSCKK